MFTQAQGWALYFGDAVSHLNTARRIVDSRTPGIDQFGSPWLPVPHLLMIPLVSHDGLWRSGLAGAIPSAISFVVTGVLLFLAARRAFTSTAAGATAAALFALNPNVLYLQSIPMTESVFLAALAGLLYFTAGASRSILSLLAMALFSNLASLSRYEGWVLIPLTAVYLFFTSGPRRIPFTLAFCLLAALGPLAWLGYNVWLSGNALEFYNGPYSAKAINQRAVDAGMARYPGDHDWLKAALYYSTAARLCAGAALSAIGIAGIVAAILRRAIWPVIFLMAPCAFYVLSMYGSGTPIFVPGLWPASYYNTRYGIVAILLLAFGAAAIVSWFPQRLRSLAALTLTIASVVPWIAYPQPDSWICWKESQVNSEARRRWTTVAATFMKNNYQPGQGIFTSFGDLSGIFEQAGIPLRETLYDGNNPAWLAAVARPEFFLREEWAVALAGDNVATAVQRSSRKGRRYRLVESIKVANAPVIEIYRRD